MFLLTCHSGLSFMDMKKIKQIEPKEKKGLIVVLTGHGKGKTTSALGMALRAVGHNLRVCIICFIKGDLYSGEIDGLKKLAPQIEYHLTGKGFFGLRGDSYLYREHRANAQQAMQLAGEKTRSGDFDLIILDEINNALSLKLVDLPQVLDLIDRKPPLMHYVLTGRDAHPEVIRRAHIATEMKEIKHAYRQGMEPQPGIDY
jgi:cob(I)alamin adenosyltransferase